MTRLRQLSFLLILVVCFWGCGDCVQIGIAKVLDSQTQNPIDSVVVFKSGRPEDTTFTNDKGNFELRSISGGLFHCPPMKVVLNKPGYQSKAVEVTSDTTTIIYLDRE